MLLLHVHRRQTDRSGEACTHVNDLIMNDVHSKLPASSCGELRNISWRKCGGNVEEN